MGPFPDHYLEQPHSLDVSDKGWVCVVDRGGRRLSLGAADENPVSFPLGFRATRCRFVGANVALLGDDGLLATLAPDGAPVGETRVRDGAVNLAVSRGGSVFVSYSRRGSQDHGVTLERLGATPLQYTDPAILDGHCLAVESGALWLAGTGSESPSARAVRLRPTAGGLSCTQTVGLPTPPRAAAVGPDGALWVVLEPGETITRVFKDRAEAPQRLPEPASELVRQGKRLFSCGPRGWCDLTHLVPRPDGSFPEPDLPGCST